MYWAYSFILFLSLLYYIPAYFIKLRIRKGESLYFKQRFGIKLPVRSTAGPSVWIHAVSVGEVLSLQNLINSFKERNPDWTVYISVLTNSGFKIASEKLSGISGVFFIPFDFTLIIKRFFKTLKPDLFILAESEFWPNLLKVAKKNCTAVFLVNGRISERSFRRYSRMKIFIKKILGKIDFFLVQTEREKNGLIDLGILPKKIFQVGNLKADVQLPMLSTEKIDRLKDQLGIPEGKKVILAGSTHRGEEIQILQAFSEAKKVYHDEVMMIAPRHPERAGEIEKFCKDLSLSYIRKSRDVFETGWDVLIIDTLGELAVLYSLCDLAFIGGSLVEWGGQNFLEPAFYSKPIFFGPYMDNFRDIAEIFVRSQAASIVKNKSELNQVFLFQDKEFFVLMGKNARSTLMSLQGATEKTLTLIERYTKQQ